MPVPVVVIIGIIGATALGALVVFTLVGVFTIDNAGQRQSSLPPIDYAPVVRYEVEHSIDADMRPTGSITYRTPTGTQQQNVRLPLVNTSGTKGLTYIFRGGGVAYISAQDTRGFGAITCRIRVDNRVVSENTSTGGYSIAQCHANIVDE